MLNVISSTNTRNQVSFQCIIYSFESRQTYAENNHVKEREITITNLLKKIKTKERNRRFPTHKNVDGKEKKKNKRKRIKSQSPEGRSVHIKWFLSDFTQEDSCNKNAMFARRWRHRPKPNRGHGN